MSFEWEKANPKYSETLKKRWSEVWRRSKEVKQMVMAMQIKSISPRSGGGREKGKAIVSSFQIGDRTLLLSDELLLRILSIVSDCPFQRNSNSLVCKRWLNLQGRLVRSIGILDWNFLLSGRLIHRFPNLNHVDLISAALISPRNSGVLLSNRLLSLHLHTHSSPNWCFFEDNMLPSEVIDNGLAVLSSACPNLRRLHLIGATEIGLLSVADDCPTLQELELQKCSDTVLRGIAACGNLQILKLVGHVDGFYNSVVSDIGLTILAQGCKRLVKVELCGCEGSFDGIKAIGKCCQMLEELTFSDHRMDDGWLAALSFFENLKTLRFQSCTRIDSNPGLDHYLGSCPSLQRLHLLNCHFHRNNNHTLSALFSVSTYVREIFLQDCWGFDNTVFAFALVCRRVKLLHLQGCSLLTTQGLESVIHSWKELQSLRVVSCKNIKDNDISPALSTLFTTLKELTWSPDTKSLLQSNLVGITMGNRGAKFFKRTR